MEAPCKGTATGRDDAAKAAMIIELDKSEDLTDKTSSFGYRSCACPCLLCLKAQAGAESLFVMTAKPEQACDLDV